VEKKIPSTEGKREKKKKNKAFYGYLEGIISIVLNTLLFGLKYWAGITTGSIAIVADAWHTLSDSLTSFVVILGFKVSSIKPDKRHPFGHGRAELISSVIIGTLLAIVGFNFFMESLQRFRNHQAAHYSTFAMIIFIFSIVVKEGLAQFSVRTGKRIGSASLIADGWHHRSDSIASVLVLVGIAVGRFLWWIDSAMGIAVSLLIFYAAFGILKESVSSLLGDEPDDSLKMSLGELLKEDGLNIVEIHHIHVHKYGEHTELTFHLRLPPEIKLKDAHSLASRLENRIRGALGIESTIHVEPKTF
jgi:cation diffusion facilitator family transporter